MKFNQKILIFLVFSFFFHKTNLSYFDAYKNKKNNSDGFGESNRKDLTLSELNCQIILKLCSTIKNKRLIN